MTRLGGMHTIMFTREGGQRKHYELQQKSMMNKSTERTMPSGVEHGTRGD